MTGRKDVKDLGIYKKYLEDRKNKLVERFEAFLNYVTQNIICRQQLILEYFDEQDIKPCGICDVCLEKKKKGSDELGKDEEELTQILKNKIAKHPQISVKELVAKFNWKQEKEILHALKTLVEIGLVKYDAMGRLDLQ